MNIRKIVEAYTQNADKESSDKTKSIQELDAKLEKLLLVGENNSNTKKAK